MKDEVNEQMNWPNIPDYIRYISSSYFSDLYFGVKVPDEIYDNVMTQINKEYECILR